MRFTDSRDHGGVGVLPFQDHSGEQTLEERFQILGARKIGRADQQGQLGTVFLEPGTTGDLIGAMLWPRSTREYSAWSFAWPSITETGAPRRTVATGGSVGAVAGGGVQFDRLGGAGGIAGDRGGIASDVTSGFGTIRGGGPLSSTVPFGGGLSGVTGGSVGGIAGLSGTAGGGSAGSAGVAGAAAGAVAAQRRKDAVVRPAHLNWQHDFRFAPISTSSPKGWPEFPRDWHGVTFMASAEEKQEEYFHPTDPRLPLVHFGGRFGAGALVCDLDKKSRPDSKRHARLHTMLRIVKTPPGGAGRNAVGWNLTVCGQGDGAGGYVVDVGRARTGGARRRQTHNPTTPRDRERGRGPTTPSDRSRDRQAGPDGTAGGGSGDGFRGPNVPGPRGRSGGAGGTRTVASGKQRLIVAMASHNVGGFAHPGTPSDPHRLGRDGDKNPVNPWHLTTRALWINPRETSEDGPLNFTDEYRDGGTLDYDIRTYLGFDAANKRFDFWTTGAEEPSPDPRLPPQDGGEPPPPPPGDPEPPPPPGTDPGVPGGPTTGGGSQSSIIGGGVQSGDSTPTFSASHTRRWAEASFAATSFRAQPWGKGLPNLLNHFRHPDRIRVNRTAPTVMRAHVFAVQNRIGAPTTAYTQKPGASRYQGGTADGSLWYLPPETGGEDYGVDFDPPERTLSNPTFGLHPNVSLGFGLPEISTGGTRDGYVVRRDLAKNLEFVVKGAAGADGVTTLELLADGGIMAANIKSGTDQTDAGAALGELYVDTNDDNTVKRGT